MRSALLRLSAVALAASAAALAGCGAEDPATDPLPAPSAGPVAVAPPSVTDGRLGDATTTRGGDTELLARGGRMRPGAGAPPRGLREGVDAAARCGAVEADPVAGNLDAIGATTLCLLNLERTTRGLAALVPNGRLAQAALAHSRDMVARKYFAHDSPEGSTPAARIRATGYIPSDRSWTVGENLAWGSGALGTPAAIVRAWMNSPGHRDNLLKPAYKEIGLGVVVGVPRTGYDGGATYATTFGGIQGSAPAAPAPATAVAPASVAPSATRRTTTRTATKRRTRSRTARSAAARRAAARRAAARRAARRAAARRVARRAAARRVARRAAARRVARRVAARRAARRAAARKVTTRRVAARRAAARRARVARAKRRAKARAARAARARAASRPASAGSGRRTIG